MKRHYPSQLLLAATFAAAAPSALAQDFTGTAPQAEASDNNYPIHIELGARMDYQRDYRQSEAFKDNCGFKGKHLMLSINGKITDKFSYAYRQRLNELHHDKSFFDGTDLLYLTYHPNERWDLTAGKIVLGFGSYEYQRHPMEMYLPSEFCAMIPCYRFGAGIGFNITPNDRLQFQFSESPFRKEHEEMYGYSLQWEGHHNWFNAIYSANVLEYRPGQFVYYLGFGHQLKFGPVTLELDYINRATSRHTFFFKDYSLIGEVAVAPADHWNVFAKASHSRNATHDAADECVWAGTDATQLGGGIEFFPLPHGNKSMRIHAAYNYCFGKNSNPDGVLQPEQHFMTVGLQWRMDLIGLAKKIWNKSKH